MRLPGRSRSSKPVCDNANFPRLPPGSMPHSVVCLGLGNFRVVKTPVLIVDAAITFEVFGCCPPARCPCGCTEYASDLLSPSDSARLSCIAANALQNCWGHVVFRSPVALFMGCCCRRAASTQFREQSSAVADRSAWQCQLNPIAQAISGISQARRHRSR